MSLKVTILGCGTSGGVPRIGNVWGACDPANPRNRRRRCALLVQRHGPKGATSVLVDTPPDLREELLDANVGLLDGVLYTHDHADHTHGIDDLRVVVYNGNHRLPVYSDAETLRVLCRRFDYCFETPAGSEYPAILLAREIAPGETVPIEGPGGVVDATAFRQIHGRGRSLGFRFGGLAYSPDVSDFPEESIELLRGLDIWIIDALRYSFHLSHFSVGQALEWIERVKPKRAILTHMHIDLDYATLARELPEGVEPAYDGMVLDVEG